MTFANVTSPPVPATSGPGGDLAPTSPGSLGSRVSAEVAGRPGARARVRSVLGPLVSAALVGLFLLWTPVMIPGTRWDPSGDVVVEPPRLGVTDPWTLVMVAAGVSVVVGVALSRRHRAVGLVLICWPFVTVPLTGTFVWGWGVGLLAVAVDASREGWRRAALPYGLSVALAAGYCFSGIPALLPAGLVTAGEHTVAEASFSFVLYLMMITAAVLSGTAVQAIRTAGVHGVEAARTKRQAQQDAAVTAERARLARDLHDVVAHHISLIAVRAEAAPYLHPDLDERAREVLGAVAGDAREALDELRQVLMVLRRAEGGDRTPQPGAADVAGLVDAARDAGQQITVTGSWGRAGAVPAGEGYVLFRVVQEALTNARRHAPGQPVLVELLEGADGRGARVSNPLDPEATGDQAEPLVPGRGLAGMCERVEASGGTVDLVRTRERMTVRVLLPGTGA